MTIAAIATALGEGGIGIVRLSGLRSLQIAQRIFQAKTHQLSYENPNKLHYGYIIDEHGVKIDEAMAVYMRAPHSYTAEDVVEIHCHGSYFILQKVLKLALNYGARLATPGEFTQRAFLNGRLDLSQAEAVMDIIRSGSDAALKLSVRQHEGLLSQQIKEYRNALKDIVVHIEAVIDYPEEDIIDIKYEKVNQVIQDVNSAINHLLKTYNTGRILRHGLRIVIAGRPNVGKSSLMNLLLREERSIVSNIAGTTRDVIEEQLLIGGIPVVVVDTAGVRETSDEIEQIGVQKAKENIDTADLILYMLDATVGLTSEDQKMLSDIAQEKHVVLVNKTDLQENKKSEIEQLSQKTDIIYISVLNKNGIDDLEKYIQNLVFGESVNSLSDNVYIQNVRHEKLLQTAKESLIEALHALEQNQPLDCVLIDVRAAIEYLGSITGETVTDEIINEIFARFCLGK